MQTMHAANQRTDPKTERLVITRIAQGIKQKEIFEEIGMPVSTIKKIKKRNPQLLHEIKQEVAKADAVSAVRLHHKGYALLERRLDRALAGVESISTKDLVSVVKEMSNQIQLAKLEAESSVNQKESRERMEELFKAIKEDDFGTIERIAFRKNETQTLT